MIRNYYQHRYHNLEQQKRRGQAITLRWEREAKRRQKLSEHLDGISCFFCMLALIGWMTWLVWMWFMGFIG